jgi:hypothetical protein
MESLEKCKKILNEDGAKYSDMEVSQIRDFLYILAQIEVDEIQIIQEKGLPINVEVYQLKNLPNAA